MSSCECPERLDFFALAEKEPENALTVLFWLFTDKEVATKRVHFLRANPPEKRFTLVDCGPELHLIKENCVSCAVEDHGVSLNMLCKMASSEETLLATFEASTGTKLNVAVA